ncbi:MAG: RNA-directed DNA polymerase, partial [Campylobacteraceae bacterium]|nr:RNA-directed DNA polymerase [Campylobacteraceae bacterium]
MSCRNKISISAWNICGANNKINDPDFVQHLQLHDIVVLSETFAQNDTIKVKGFKSTNVIRNNRHKKAKRSSGGVSILIKNDISEFVQTVSVTAEHLVWIKIDKRLTGYSTDTYCCCAYIPPIKSPYFTTHPDLNLFELLQKDVMKYTKLGSIMITGDLNARIGLRADTLEDDSSNGLMDSINSQHVIDVPRRSSMDHICNVWGKNLLDLCFAHNLCMLNGRTLGDLEGRYTYYNPFGNSTIDVTLVDKDLLSSVLTFEVHDLTEFTSHCKISTVISCRPFKINPTESRISKLNFNKYKWNPVTSPEKLVTALKSRDFIIHKEKILNKKYDSNEGSSQLAIDVEKLTKLLQDKCCDKVRVGKKSKCQTKKQPWFNLDCRTLRNRVRRAGNYLGRNPNNQQARDEYYAAKRQYIKLVKKTRKNSRDMGLLNLIKSVDKQEMWSLLSKLRVKKPSSPIEITKFYSHFEKLLNHTQKTINETKLNSIKNKLEEFLNDTNSENTMLSPGKYKCDFIIKMAKSLRNGKSSFLDGSINEVIKYAINDMCMIYCKLFNHIEVSAEFPHQWKSSFLVPLHKKGSSGDTNNYRGLAVGNNISKFYTKCLNEKLKNFCNVKNILSPHQFGFRDDFRTTDAIFVLRSIISYYKNCGNKPVYACFVDFNKAFDSVVRTAMMYKLGKIGITGNLLKLMESMYTKSTHIIKSNGEYSVPFETKLGVKQGCNLSPLLFNIFINDIHDIFDPSCKPLNINNWNISSMSFADDLILMSETYTGLTESINKLNTYCLDWGLSVNVSKTKVITFNRPFNKKFKNLKFSIDGENISVTNSYCYLGVEMSNTGSFHKASELLYKKALRALYSIYSSLNVYSNETSVKLFLKLFDSLIKPILLYGSEVWGSYQLTTNSPIVKFVNKFYRTLLAVPNSCSTMGTHVELGRFPINTNISKSILKFWIRLITLPADRLVSHCYWSLLNIPSLKDNWIDSIKNMLNSSGQPFLWEAQYSLGVTNLPLLSRLTTQIITTIQDQFIQTS